MEAPLGPWTGHIPPHFCYAFAGVNNPLQAQLPQGMPMPTPQRAPDADGSLNVHFKRLCATSLTLQPLRTHLNVTTVPRNAVLHASRPDGNANIDFRFDPDMCARFKHYAGILHWDPNPLCQHPVDRPLPPNFPNAWDHRTQRAAIPTR